MLSLTLVPLTWSSRLCLKEIFKDWLEKEYPDRAAKVMALVKSVRGGKENDPNFGTRMAGQGPYAWTIGRRFQLAAQRLGLNTNRVKLRTDLFAKPPRPGEQMSLI